jgi:hypothetical protein
MTLRVVFFNLHAANGKSDITVWQWCHSAAFMVARLAVPGDKKASGFSVNQE